MIENTKKISILFVCMGNICRSPTAEGVFRKLVADAGLAGSIHIDSAGTHAYHSDEPPDWRACAAAERRGYSLEGIRARRVTAEDFDAFDYVLAMDEDNAIAMRARAAPELQHKIELFLSYAAAADNEVPDPYFGGAAGFERVLDLIEDGARGLLDAIRRQQGVQA